MFSIFNITVTQESNNVFVAECPDLEGAWAEGKTAEVAVENCKDAILGVLQYMKENSIKIKIPKSIKTKTFSFEYPLTYA